MITTWFTLGVILLVSTCCVESGVIKSLEKDDLKENVLSTQENVVKAVKKGFEEPQKLSELNTTGKIEWVKPVVEPSLKARGLEKNRARPPIGRSNTLGARPPAVKGFSSWNRQDSMGGSATPSSSQWSRQGGPNFQQMRQQRQQQQQQQQQQQCGQGGGGRRRRRRNRQRNRNGGDGGGYGGGQGFGNSGANSGEDSGDDSDSEEGPASGGGARGGFRGGAGGAGFNSRKDGPDMVPYNGPVPGIIGQSPDGNTLYAHCNKCKDKPENDHMMSGKLGSNNWSCGSK